MVILLLQFGVYFFNNEKMMRRLMIRNVRKKVGMFIDKMGNVLRCYINQFEIVNNKFIWQKEVISGKVKSKSDLMKFEFVCDVWE